MCVPFKRLWIRPFLFCFFLHFYSVLLRVLSGSHSVSVVLFPQVVTTTINFANTLCGRWLVQVILKHKLKLSLHTRKNRFKWNENRRQSASWSHQIGWQTLILLCRNPQGKDWYHKQTLETKIGAVEIWKWDTEIVIKKTFWIIWRDWYSFQGRFRIERSISFSVRLSQSWKGAGGLGCNCWNCCLQVNDSFFCAKITFVRCDHFFAWSFPEKVIAETTTQMRNQLTSWQLLWTRYAS